jgi:hypothetical protein
MAACIRRYLKVTWRRSLGAISQRSFACSSGRRQLGKRHRKPWWRWQQHRICRTLQCVELSQGEFGSGPARCGLDAILKVKYETRAASSTDSTTAPLRPGNSYRAAHNPSGQRRREAAESGSPDGKPEEAAMARFGNRPHREHRKGRRGRKGSFWCFCLHGTGNKDKVLTV